MAISPSPRAGRDRARGAIFCVMAGFYLLLAIGGGINVVNVELIRMRHGEPAFSLPAFFVSLLFLGGIVAMAAKAWQQKLWTVWLPGCLFTAGAVVGIATFPKPGVTSTQFAAALSGGIRVYCYLAAFFVVLTVLLKFLDRRPFDSRSSNEPQPIT